MSQELIIVITLALIFDFLNGMRDASNIVATMISSRAFGPRTALTITAIAEFLGPFLFGVVVAKTIGDEIVQSSVLSLGVIAASLIGAIVWNLITWFFGIPGSSSHALIGGMVGAVLASAGISAIKFEGLNKVLIALFASPLIGFFSWFSRYAVHLFFSAGCNTAHQRIFQAEPIVDRYCACSESWHERCTENHGDHHVKPCHRRSSSDVSNSHLGGGCQRGRDRNWDEPGRMAINPHAGREVL